jgi:hypothetical protein
MFRQTASSLSNCSTRRVVLFLAPGGRPGFPGWNGRPRIFLGDICKVIVRLPIAHAKSLMLARFKPTSPGAIIARISNPRTRGTTARFCLEAASRLP